MTEAERKKYRDLLGKYIEDWTKEKFGSQSKAAEMLGVSKYKVNRAITGVTPPDADLMLAMQRWGFDEMHFNRWKALDQVLPDQLSKRELIELAIQQKMLIDEAHKFINIVLDYNATVNKRMDEALKMIGLSIKKIEK